MIPQTLNNMKKNLTSILNGLLYGVLSILSGFFELIRRIFDLDFFESIILTFSVSFVVSSIIFYFVPNDDDG